MSTMKVMYHATTFAVTGLTAASIAILASGGPKAAYYQLTHNAEYVDSEPEMLSEVVSPECGRPPYKCLVKNLYPHHSERKVLDQNLKCMALTLFGEASGGSAAEVVAKGQVIMNRLNSGQYGDTTCAVVKHKSKKAYAFTVWNPKDVNYMRMYRAEANNTKEFRRMVRISIELQNLGSGEYTHYWSPDAQKRLTGVSSPSWAKNCTKKERIGRSVFCQMGKKQQTQTADLNGIY